ncbi:tRNA-dihydrouridine(20) synthase [NAD(P)+]-like [Prorops nasuta]|uniref:tRNA-dihydrouridine(20) synthase [NAD(P)+]-like n=1 Tax=Prorops nasuta TaxID=863751 RepID=UPI0034CEE587
MESSKRFRLNYENKLILAPMVRIGTLPMRLLALDYGADIVYTEELIDLKLLRSVRKENIVLNTIDYIDKTDGTVVFRTCPKERHHVVLQIGTCDPSRALEVAKIVESDVAAIDINMGCPKKFSMLGGMGAALLSKPEKAKQILETLVKNLKIPITCKIRVLENLEDTIKLVKSFELTGIAAIAIHGRTIDERPQHANRDQYLKEISNRLTIPIIANGGSRDIQTYKDIFSFKKSTGCTSVMLARSAEWNCSIFRKEGLLSMEEVIKAYLKYAVDYDNSPSNTKYCVQNILRELQESQLGRKFLGAQTLEQICAVWDMDDYYRLKEKEFHDQGYYGRYNVKPSEFMDSNHEPMCKKQKFDDEGVTKMCCAFLRNSYNVDNKLPKSQLIDWSVKQGKKMPQYETFKEEKLFRSIVTFDGKRYGSSFWEKKKKWAEQGAALVCLHALGINKEIPVILNKIL